MATYYVDISVGNDSNAGTSAGSGNAWATLNKASGAVAAGDKVYVKASGSYSELWSASTTAGTESAGIVWEGYTTTPGDGGRVTIDGSISSMATGLSTNKNYQTFKNFIFTKQSSSAIDFTATITDIYFINCHFIKSTGAASYCFNTSTFSAAAFACFSCYISSYLALASYTSPNLYECTVYNSGYTTRAYSGPVQLQNSLFYTDTNVALVTVSSNDTCVTITNCTFHGGKALTITGSSYSRIIIENNIFSGGTYGIDGASLSTIYNDYNAYYNQSTAQTHNITVGPNSTTVTSDPFTNSSGGDFSLKSTGGGLQCATAGRGATLPNLGSVTRVNYAGCYPPSASGGGSSNLQVSIY